MYKYILAHHRWIIGIIVAVAIPFVIYFLNLPYKTTTYYFATEYSGKSQDKINLSQIDCWVHSLSSNRPDAFRCMINDVIKDPCFMDPNDPTIVVCPLNPYGENEYFKVDPTKEIFRQGISAENSIDRYPWFIKLFDNTECTFYTGVSGGIAGMRIDYGCGGKNNIESLLLPLSQEGSLLKIDCYNGKLITTCDIKEAWY